MIFVKNIYKSFGKEDLFKDLSITFPERGLIALCGPSGCGKTTLLNIISGLITPDKGSIFHDTVDISSLCDEQLSIYRLKHFGFIFQDFKLFESETVFNNIALPLDSLTYTSPKIKQRKINDLLNLVHIDSKINQNVNLLSGGEKQRVCIARSLVNNPTVIFADEPTGSLDEKNAKEVMEILKIVSTYALIVMVSHDIELTKKYANKIIYMEDGNIKDIEEISEVKEKEYLPILKEKKRLKKVCIPLSFLFHHSIKKMREKKYRTMFSNMVMSLSLIGVGASISLTSSISTNIKKAYGDILGEDRICVDKKVDEVKNYGIYSIQENEVDIIANQLSPYIKDIGVTYYIDYEHFFTNDEQLTFKGENNREFYVGGLYLRDINDYTWLEDVNTSDIYPSQIDVLKNDEVVLALDIEMIREICFGLQIERTLTSLNGYLQFHKLYLNLNAENYDWGYNNFLSFEVKGFLLEKIPKIYHSKHNWNEIVFENLLGFPNTNFISGYSKYPWDLRKIYYLKLSKPSESLLTYAFYSEELMDYIFEIPDKSYYPNLFRDVEINDIDRLLVFKDYRNQINQNISPYIIKECSYLSDPIFASYGGYSIYPSAFMSGFAKPTYFATSEEKLDDTIDSLSSFSDITSDVDNLPEGVISGYFANSMQENVMFLPIDNSRLTKNLTLHEVIISEGLAKILFEDKEAINNKIYLTFNKSEIALSNNKVKREFASTSLIVKGVVPGNKYYIHHRSEWSVLFFQCHLGVSIFSLGIYSISYSVDGKDNIEMAIDRGNRLFNEFGFYNPMNDFNLGVDEICNFIQIALLIFSFVSIVVSILLLSTCSYLHVIENKKDIGLARCIGIPKLEATKFIFAHSFISSFLSFTLSSIELLIFTFFSMYTISKMLNSSSVFTFNPLSLLVMFGITFIIALISSGLFSIKITKMDPISSIK